MFLYVIIFTWLIHLVVSSCYITLKIRCIISTKANSFLFDGVWNTAANESPEDLAIMLESHTFQMPKK